MRTPKLRRFRAGDTGVLPLEDGRVKVPWRAVQGKRSPSDVRFEYLINGEWVSEVLPLVFLVHDQLYDNEEVIAPELKAQDGKNRKGGPYLRDNYRRVERSGFQAGIQALEIESGLARGKLFG